MLESLLSFRLFGFDVAVQPTFALVVAYYALSGVSAQNLVPAIAWVLALTIGVIVHELGHAWVARSYGLRVGAIVLYGLGGYVTHSATTAGRQFVISVAGPFAGFALGLVAMVAALALNAVGLRVDVWLEPFVTVSFFYGLLNLLPAFPLDGGKALHSALTVLASDRVGRVVTGGLGLAIGAAAVWYGVQIQAWFLVVLAVFLMWTNFQSIQR